jgi:pyruvate dehydrogenase E1 component beta subunit
MNRATYITHIVQCVNEVTDRCGPILLYGENINYGSCIGGLARGLTVNPAGSIQNVGNFELTHVGLGLGILLDGGQAALFGKQLDFIVLGLEQACDTFNFIRAYKAPSTWGSFTIFVVVCDQGYQGPQSSMNSAGDFASLVNIPVFCLNGAADAKTVVQQNFASPGFRVICLSQRLFSAPALTMPAEWFSADGALFRYRTGDDATVVSFNFSLRDALDLDTQLAATGVHSDLFHMNFVPGADMSPVLESCRRTGKLVLVDDSKTVTKFGDILIAELAQSGAGVEVLSFCRRGCSDHDYGANEDRFVPDVERALAFVQRSRTDVCHSTTELQG